MKKYLKLKDSNKVANYLKCETYYNLGGTNYWTSKVEKRGYYLSVSPVYRENHGTYVSERYAQFTGAKMILKEVSRKSKKSENLAEEIAETELQNLIQYVLDENELELEEEK